MTSDGCIFFSGVNSVFQLSRSGGHARLFIPCSVNNAEGNVIGGRGGSRETIGVIYFNNVVVALITTSFVMEGVGKARVHFGSSRKSQDRVFFDPPART